jgi:DNA transposition AAA+ family ATPase
MDANEMLTVGECERIRKEIAEVQAVDHISDAQMAKALDISTATFSQIKNSKYTGTTHRYLKEWRLWLLNRRDAIRMPTQRFVMTSIAGRIISTCEMAADLPCIAMVQTPSGWGKTAALMEVQRRMGRTGAVLLSAGETCRGKRDLLFELAKRLGATVSENFMISEMYNAVRQHLAQRTAANKGRSFLILIDEATTLLPDTISMLRNLHDDEQCHPAIVLADTVSRMTLTFRVRKSVPGGHEQLLSRAKAKYIVNVATDRDSETENPNGDIIPIEDVSAVSNACLANLGYKVHLSKNALKYLHGLSKKDGALRNVTARLQGVHYYAVRRNLRTDFSVAQLDYLGHITGDDVMMDHDALGNPFKQSVPINNEPTSLKAAV